MRKVISSGVIDVMACHRYEQTTSSRADKWVEPDGSAALFDLIQFILPWQRHVFDCFVGICAES